MVRVLMFSQSITSRLKFVHYFFYISNNMEYIIFVCMRMNVENKRIVYFNHVMLSSM